MDCRWRPSRMTPSSANVLIADSSAPWDVLCHRRLPVAAVETFRRERQRAEIVEAAGVDVDLVRVRTRHVERMNAARPAEMMLGDLGVELVSREIGFTLQQLELFARHDQVPDAFLGADRTIADRYTAEIGRDAETHPAAVASAVKGLRHRSLDMRRIRLSDSLVAGQPRSSNAMDLAWTSKC